MGLIPSAAMATRAFSQTPSTDVADIRSQGTGNPGALNVGQTVGTSAGLIVMGADIAKGYAAGVVGRKIAGPAGANAAASAAVVGHCYPITAGFSGGKGVATSIGQVLATFPVYFPIDVAVALVSAANPKMKHRTFTAKTIASGIWIGTSSLWWRKRWNNSWGPEPTGSLPLGALVSSAVIFSRFRSSLVAARSTS
jgi:acyl phosphate:glycerol-3-phosphate acyltransferase